MLQVTEQQVERNGRTGMSQMGIPIYCRPACVERNIPAEEAVEKLLRLIRENGDDPEYAS